MVKDYLETGYLTDLSEQVVTILFIDIVHSTTLAEKVGAQKFRDPENSRAF